ncbi:MAG: tetratricopeptide repeat protein [Bacteroidota bacterium]
MLLTTIMGLKGLKIQARKLFTALLMVMIISCMEAPGQEPGFVPDRDLAERAFNRGDYSTALKHYKALSENYTADPLYKYYKAACFVNMEQEPVQAINLLKEAINSSSSIRSVPSDAWYYLGRAYQLNGDYDLAIEAYVSFRDLAQRKEIRELNIDALITECKEREGAITEDEQFIREPDRFQEQQADQQVGQQDEQPAEDPGQPPGRAYEELAKEALEYQFRADSVHRLADRYRQSLTETAEPDRQTLRAKILSLEQAGFEYQRMADQKYREAARMVSHENDDILTEELQSDKTDAALEAGEAGEQEGDKVQEREQVLQEKETDSIQAAAVDVKTVQPDVPARRPEPVLSLFSEQYEQEEIPVNPELPEGLVYRIQLAAFRNPQEPSFFGGMGPLSIYRAEGSDVNFYYTGLFRTKEEAEKALVKVKKKKFNDAFIIAIMDGARISMEKAEQLEKQWSYISLFGNDTIIKPLVEEAEPPTLLYRVQVMRVKEKVDDDDELDLLERLADKRSYDIFETADNEYVYLIGKFLTFESAETYADLLYRNGMEDAKVVAYLGRKEIPLETAKQLFDLYFEK